MTGWHGHCELNCASQTPSGVQDIMGPSQAEVAQEEGEQVDNEDEAEAASACEAEAERPQAAEHGNEGALVIYQPPPLQAISSAKVATPGEESPPSLYHPAVQLSAL